MTDDVKPRDIIRPSHINRITPDDGEIIVGGEFEPVRRPLSDFDNSAVLAQVDAELVGKADISTVDTLAAQVARVDPGANILPGHDLAFNVEGSPFVRYAKAWSPDQFGGVGNGVADDTAALVAMFAAVESSGGGRIDLLGRRWNCTVPLTTNVPILLDGGLIGAWDGNTLPIMGYIHWPAGVAGLKLGPGSQMSTLKRVGFNCNSHVENGPWTGHGLHIQGKRTRLEQVFVRGFGEHGIFIDGNLAAQGTNANLGTATLLHVTRNGGNGIHINRQDANVWTFETCNASSNKGYGFYNQALLQNNFLGCHTAYNELGDYWEGGNGSMWMNPYSEGGGKFIIDNSATGLHLTIPGGASEGPQLWFGTEGTYTQMPYGTDPAYIRDWTITRSNRTLTATRWQGIASGQEFVWSMDRSNMGELMLFDQTNGERVLVVDPGATGQPPSVEFECHVEMKNDNNIILGTGTGTKIGTSTTQKVGFFNATPVIRPSAITGATDTERLNDLIAKLQSLGLIG